MSEKVGYFDICKEMAQRGLDIRMSLLENVTNLSYSKRTKGTTVSIGVDGNLVGSIFNNEFIGGLLLCKKEDYFAGKNELEAGPAPKGEKQMTLIEWELFVICIQLTLIMWIVILKK